MSASDPSLRSSIIVITALVLYVIAIINPGFILLISIILSFFIPYAWHANDESTNRRRFWRMFENSLDRPAEWKKIGEKYNLKEKYWVSNRGMCLMTSIITPRDSDIKAAVFFCHGYTGNASFLHRVEYQRYVERGIALVTIEYEGHGRSDGLNGLISSWDLLIDDTFSFFNEVIQNELPGLKYFLAGESMGGAIAYHTYNRDPSIWSGIIFLAPMVGRSPSKVVMKILKLICGEVGSKDSFLGRLPILPAGNLSGSTHRLEHRKQLASTVPTVFTPNLRLITAREMLYASHKISQTCKDFDAPFLIQHGLDDKVANPKLSEIFYQEARSKDKDIKLYEGMWHALTTGESKENIDLVFHDAITWIMERI